MTSGAALLSPSPAILALHEALLASPSATAVLRAHFGDPVHIERLAGTAPPDAAMPARLRVADAAEIMHRRVRLHAAGRPVSEADLWYVPARLWPGMAESLATTTIPFGTVVAPMRPARETINSRIFPATAAFALQHVALLTDNNGLPIAMVNEFYCHVSSA